MKFNLKDVINNKGFAFVELIIIAIFILIVGIIALIINSEIIFKVIMHTELKQFLAFYVISYIGFGCVLLVSTKEWAFFKIHSLFIPLLLAAALTYLI